MSTKSDKEKGKRPRLWVVSELYYPEMTSTGYYLTKIAEGLADDFDVRVICGQPNYSARGTRAPKRENLKGVEVYRGFGTRLDKNVIPFRIINMLTLGVSVFLRSLISFRNGDRVLVVTTPPLMPFLTGIAAKLRGSSHILLIHDRYPEILYAVGKLKRGSLTARILEMMSRSLIRSADRIIAVGRDMKKALSGLNEESRIYVIPNWAELETVEPGPRSENELLLEQGLSDKFVFLYAGNMGYPNDIETILEAANRVRETDPEIHFIFLGAGVKKTLLEKTVKHKHLRNITVLNSRPRSQQQVFLNACDVGLVSLVKLMSGVSMPSRTYNILAAGKPILALCDRDSEVSKVLKEDNVGWSVEPGDLDGLVDVILKIKSSSEKIAEYGKNARIAALTKYSLEKAVESYRSVFLSDS
ncbi:MAG: glycosyltransferase family 4 protein [Pyrinomonadaceae bacterium]|nr:glycosyltransferase family 4 protein [Pyrinomonadaceae bacterium]